MSSSCPLASRHFLGVSSSDHSEISSFPPLYVWKERGDKMTRWLLVDSSLTHLLLNHAPPWLPRDCYATEQGARGPTAEWGWTVRRDTRFGWKNSSIRALRGRRVTHFQSIFTHAHSSWPHLTLADPLTQVKPIWTGEPSCVQSYSSQE